MNLSYSFQFFMVFLSSIVLNVYGLFRLRSFRKIELFLIKPSWWPFQVYRGHVSFILSFNKTTHKIRDNLEMWMMPPPSKYWIFAPIQDGDHRSFSTGKFSYLQFLQKCSEKLKSKKNSYYLSKIIQRNHVKTCVWSSVVEH